MVKALLRTHDNHFPKTKIYNYAVYPHDLDIGIDCIIGANTVIRDGVRIGNNTIIGPLNMIESYATIGNNVTLQPHGVFCRDMVIQDNVFIGPHFSCANNPYIPDGEHGTSTAKKPDVERTIIIKKGTRIGTRCTISPGVTVGEDCFIKMNCIIYADVPDHTVLEAGTIWIKQSN